MLGARRCRSISPARTALSSKLAARRCCGHMTGQTYGRRDGLDRYKDPAPHTRRALPVTQLTRNTHEINNVKRN